MKHKVLFLSAVVVGAASLGACLGRTGVGEDDIAAAGGGTPGEDGAVVDTAVGTDSGPVSDTSVGDTPVRDSGRPDTAPPPSDSIDFFDIFPIPDSGPLGECATCVKNNCADAVNKCLNDPDCRAGMLCTITTCLAGGGGTPDLTCVLGCFGGDFSKALEAINAFSCVVGKCGSSCGGIFGGGGDGGGPPPPSDASPPTEAGGGGGSSEAGSGGAHLVPSSMSPMSIDHAWTVDELMSLDPSTPVSFSPTAFDAWKEQLKGTGCGAR